VKKAGENEIDLKNWSVRFREFVDNDTHARNCRDTLKTLGIDPEEVSGLLALCCQFEGNPAVTFIEKLRVQALRESRNALKLAARLEADRDMLKAHSTLLPDSFLTSMQQVENRLRADASEVQTLFSKHKLNTSLFLSWLFSSIEQKTGSPHYREISFLLECAYLAYGEDGPFVGEEALRKMHRRFMRTNPFRDWMSPEGKMWMVIGGLIVYILKYLTELNGPVSKEKKGEESEPITLEALMESLAPIQDR
jgi:hypothetical protein